MNETSPQSKHAALPSSLQAFWRDHGREWAQQDASPYDLQLVGELAERVVALSPSDRLTAIESALKSAWSEGFSAATEAFGWNDMNDGLPPAALVAFVEGAGAVWAERQSAP